jgi:serine/threonine-protein kinase
MTQTPEVTASAAVSIMLDEDELEEAGYWTGGDIEDDEDKLVGTTLSDTYEVLRILGEGGMGRVYEAQHTRIKSKRFAVKALHPEFARRKDVLARFQREVEAAASINSPHVVGVYDVGETADGRPYLVSELLEGEELGDYLDKVGMMSIGPAVRVVRQVCKALSAAHGQGVVHRDIKPENVYLAGDHIAPTAKVLDFGISRLDGQGGNTLTKTGMVMGTPSYMAPEQARGERVDHRTDIYATGAILYRALTGKLPFDKTDATATLAAVLTEEPERPRTLAPHIPEHLELIIQRAMARNPDERYQSIDDFDVALIAYDEDGAAAAGAGDAAMSGRRPRMPSQTTIVGGSDEQRMVRGARSELGLLTAAIAIGGILTLMALTTGIIRLIRGGSNPTVTGTEALVVGLVVLVGLSTPLVLAALHIRKTTWDNTAKVLELSHRLRDPVLVGLATAGLLAILLRVVEGLFLRAPLGLTWPVWDVVVPIAGAITGTGTFLWHKWRPALPGTAALAVIALFGVTFVTALGVTRNSEGDTVEQPIAEASASASAAETPDGNDKAKAGTGSAKLPGVLKGDKQRAQKVWARLYKEIQKRQVKSALASLEEFAQLDPGALEDKDVRNAVIRLSVMAFLRRDQLSDQMAVLLTTKLGKGGVDLMFELIVTKGGTEAARQADRMLKDAEVRQRGSAAMQVAYDIRLDKSCEAKKKHIARAAEIGDHRALREIKILQRCYRGRPCCLRGDGATKDAVNKIVARQHQ